MFLRRALLPLVLASCLGAALSAAPQLGPGQVVRAIKISELNTPFEGGLDPLDQLGRATVCPGDIDGDGTQDLVAGAIGDDDGGVVGLDSDTGALWVFFLLPDGDVRESVKISATFGGLEADFTTRDQFGRSIEALGDLDGDGTPDIAVGAARDDDGGISRGAIYVLFLTRDGTVKGQQKISSTEGGFAGPLHDYDEFGRSIANLGDLDGDGVVDLAVGAIGDDDGGAESKGAVWILFLNADGTVKAHQKISETSGGFLGGIGREDFFGFAAASLGDLDRDGVIDLAVGAPKDDDGGVRTGTVWILFLRSNGTVRAYSKISDVNNVLGLDFGAEFGSSIAMAGDLDGDGVQDMAVGAPLDDGLYNDSGAVVILFLRMDGTVRATQEISAIAGNFTGALAPGDWFGMAVSNLGDLDGDGVTDIAVGARFDDDGGFNTGSVWLLFLAGVPNVAPTCDFDAIPTRGPAPLSVAFGERASAGANLYAWDFGDGTFSTLADPTHIYSEPGTYTVTLQVSGPGGSTTLVRADLVEAQIVASASVRNGSGVNALCTRSTSPPALGTTWTAEVDASAHPGAGLTFLLGSSAPLAGKPALGHELLIAPPALGGTLFFTSTVHSFGGIATHANPIPDVPALSGLEIFTQGLILGGGAELCNAVDLVLGY